MTRGFTLVEMLVVLVIIGLVAGTVVLTLPDDGGVRRDALRLAARATLAQEESIISGSATGLDVTASGYAFYRFQNGAWQTFKDERTLAPVTWREGVAVGLDRKGAPTRAVDEKAAKVPLVVFDPVGLVTDFAVTLEEDGEKFIVSADAAGKIKVSSDAQQ
jgi:general secretion pathway protein H